jgi:hypothetical protein
MGIISWIVVGLVAGFIGSKIVNKTDLPPQVVATPPFIAHLRSTQKTAGDAARLPSIG